MPANGVKERLRMQRSIMDLRVNQWRLTHKSTSVKMKSNTELALKCSLSNQYSKDLFNWCHYFSFPSREGKYLQPTMQPQNRKIGWSRVFSLTAVMNKNRIKRALLISHLIVLEFSRFTLKRPGLSDGPAVATHGTTRMLVSLQRPSD